MKRLFIFLAVSLNALAATEFTVTVYPPSGAAGYDYSSLNAAAAGMQNDLTLATIKVFSISSATSPTIAAGDSVLGLTSAASGTCVLVNAANTQILIKAISGTFQSGETVKKLTDVTKEVVLSNAGDSPLIGIACYAGSGADTVGGTISGFTTDSTHLLKIYTPINQRHSGVWSTSAYRLMPTTSTAVNLSSVQYVQITGLQIRPNNHVGISLSPANSAGECDASKNIFILDNSSGGQYGLYTTVTSSANLYAWDNVFYNWNGIGDVGCYVNAAMPTSLWNNTFASNTYGTYRLNGTAIMVNNICVSCTHASGGTWAAGTDYNATDNATIEYTVTGGGNTHDRLSQSFTFVNAGANNYQLKSTDAGAKGFGKTDPSSGLFSDDIAGTGRTVPWDIGAWVAQAAASTVLPPLIAGRTPPLLHR